MYVYTHKYTHTHTHTQLHINAYNTYMWIFLKAYVPNDILNYNLFT